MLHAKVRSALRTRLLAWSWIEDNDYQDRVAWEGLTFEAESETYIREKLLPGNSKLIALGPKAPIRHRGLYQIDVMVVSSYPTKEADQLAGELVEWFSPNLQLTYGGQVVDIVSCYRGQSVPDPRWTQTPITVEWYADTFNVI